jgi:DNA-binding PadR family transcriptional regulator
LIIERNQLEVKMKTLTRHEEHVLLTILKLQGKGYLVTIKDFLKKNSSKDLSFGTLYVSLNRLQKAGYISPIIGESTAKRGGKAIKYYNLTKKGLQVLTQVRKIQDKMWENFPELSYKMQNFNE